MFEFESQNKRFLFFFFHSKAIKGAEINLRYISTLTPWVHRLRTKNLAEDAQYIFSGLFHTLLLIWQHSKYSFIDIIYLLYSIF